MKLRATTISIFLLLVSLAASATEFGARVGYYGQDIKKAFGGAEVAFAVGPVVVTPSVDYIRVSGVNLWFASGDVQYVGRRAGAPWWWLGAGPTYGYARFQGISGHDWGWDVNAGVGWELTSVKPYVTLRYVKIKDLKAPGAAVGLRFGGR
jgi:hypothetical protein